ncbi:MAG: hypothetical protein ACLTMP_03000 [Eggerthella lenta]
MRKRLEKALSTGGFDAEAGVSLEDASAAAREATAPTSNRAWESVQLARNVHRPTALAYIDSFVDGFIELHGDRMFGDDGAVVCGLGWIGGRAVTVIAQEKGRDLKERIARNFARSRRATANLCASCVRPRVRPPVVCLVDTQGAFCGMEAGRGQGNAIADNLLALAGLRVPVVACCWARAARAALALALADRVAMQGTRCTRCCRRRASRPSCGRIARRQAAAVMKMSAAEACGWVSGRVLSEGAGPAHENPEQAAEGVRSYVCATLDELCATPTDELLRARYERFGKF